MTTRVGTRVERAGTRVEPVEAASSDTDESRVMAIVMKQPLHREILYKTLGFCREQRALVAVEAEIATYPEFEHGTQDQYHLISFLVDAGGLERIELDAAGEIVTEERTAGLSEDEIDDLVVSHAFVTTEAGTTVFDELSPGKRIRDLLDGMPEHADTLVEVMAFCRESRTYQEIEDFIGDPGAGSPGAAEEDAVHPSYFVNTLEAVGALVWAEGWLLSDDGRALLESVRKEP